MGAWKKQKRIDLNPSAADRWTTCTASPKFIFDNWDKLPQEDRKYSDEGNTAHEVAAALLQNRSVNPKDCPVSVNAEMNWHAWNYAEFVESLVQPGGILRVEQKLPLFYCESRNAIVDAAVLNVDSLHIVDYKYGEGIIVSPEDNLQAVIYAKSVVWSKPPTTDDYPISVTIYQPRTRNEEPLHTWSTTWGVVWEKAKRIFDIAVNILHVTDPINPRSDNLEFKPSEKACQWCPAKGFCEARHMELTKEIEPLTVIDGRPRPLGRVLTEPQLAAVVRHGDEIKKWISDVQDFALQHMRAGGTIEGFKLVMSRGGNRYWSDANAAAKYLQSDTMLRRDEIFSEKIVGPATIEKLLGKGKFPTRVYNLITKPPGQPVIAPLDDTRESAIADATKEFTNLDNLDEF